VVLTLPAFVVLLVKKDSSVNLAAIALAGIISARLAGKLRFMDSREVSFPL
jgi:hypothetical protein